MDDLSKPLSDAPLRPCSNPRCPAHHRPLPADLDHFAPDARSGDHLSKLCRACKEKRKARTAQHNRDATAARAAAARADGRLQRERLRDEEIARLTEEGVILPGQHPIRLLATDDRLATRLHLALLDRETAGAQTYERLSSVSEDELRRRIVVIGPRMLIRLYSEMNSLCVALPLGATPISRLALIAEGKSTFLREVYGDGDPDHPRDHPNTPGCTCGYCHDETA
jgi:hypothetical protein